MKIFKVLAVNIFIIFFLFMCSEFYYAYKWDNFNIIRYFRCILFSLSVDKYFDNLYKNKIITDTFMYSFREDINTNSDKKPILFMGCSYTWGDSLDANETLPAKVAELTKRPVYNRAGSGWGLAQFLYQFRRGTIYSQMQEPEYIIYVLIQDHVNRLDKFKIIPSVIDFQPKYIQTGEELKEQKPHFYDRFYTVLDYQYKYNQMNGKVSAETVKLYFQETEKEIRKHWKNTKLVVLIYPTMCDNNLINEIEKELVNSNYLVINTKDLTTENILELKYRQSEQDSHPSALAWKVIAPALSKTLNLK